MTGSQSWPAYLALLNSGELAQRAMRAHDHLRSCDLCPRECGVDRTVLPESGICRGGASAIVASFQPGYSEETIIAGPTGSGLIFFASCNLRCEFCHNARISQSTSGQLASAAKLSAIMLHFQSLGCSNINLVTPTHVLPFILDALVIAAQRGLQLPLVYNTSGYERVAILQELLDGIVDIYLPDLKFADEETAQKYVHASNYPATSQAAVLEMQRQVGDLHLGTDGLASRGLIIRHLVLPEDQAGTYQVLRFIAERVSPHAWVSLLHYRPSHLALESQPLDHYTSTEEYNQALHIASSLGLRNTTRHLHNHLL